MSFPLQPHTFTFEAISITLWQPLLQRDDLHNEPPPYWAQVWPAAKALACFIATHAHLVRDKKVVELGAGLGLPSMVAAHFAKSVYCTDSVPQAVEVAARSMVSNRLSNMDCAVLNWNDYPVHLKEDVVLLSDVNYEPQVFQTLQELIKKLTGKGITVLLSTPQRLAARSFMEPLLAQVVARENHAISHAGAMVDVTVFVLQKHQP